MPFLIFALLSAAPTWSPVHPVGPVLVVEQAGLVVASLEAQRCARSCNDVFKSRSAFSLAAFEGSGARRWVDDRTPRLLGALRDTQGQVSALVAADASGDAVAILDPATGNRRALCRPDSLGLTGSSAHLTPFVTARGELFLELLVFGPAPTRHAAVVRIDVRDDQCQVTDTGKGRLTELPLGAPKTVPQLKDHALSEGNDRHGRWVQVKGQNLDVRVPVLAVEGPCVELNCSPPPRAPR